MLIPMGPGVICEMATMSVNVVSSIHPCTVTTSFWMSESMAYPPPIVNIPMMKNVMNSSMNIISSPPFSFCQYSMILLTR